MFRLLKCTVQLNSQIIKKQSTIFVSGYHCTSNLNGDIPTSSVTRPSNEITPYQSVADFYAGKSIFLTGATGFLGKAYIEKLLSSCPELDKIFVLIRPKKGSPVQQRLQDLLDNPIFSNLKSTKPGYLKKVIPIAGDVTEPELGLTLEDEQTLIDKVSVVFHSAAIVKFSEPFKKTLDVNLEGTRKVMNLSQQMKNLEIFVYISTAFSNSDRLVIEEMVYPPPDNLDDVNKFAKSHSSYDEETEKFLRGHANPYSFSKAMAEALLLESNKNMPTIIVRPSIVSPIYRSPLPGWLDSWVAGTAIFSDVSRGLTRIVYGSNNIVIDLIPVDYVCNLTIVAAAKSPKTQELLVYNSCSSSTNPITWVGAANLFTKNGRKFGFSELPFPRAFVSQSALVVSLVTFLAQTVPSFTADLWLRITGRKPKYMKLQPRAVLLRDVLKNFTNSNYLIKSDHARKLMASLDENDRQQFMCDPKTINWEEYMPTYCYGVKRYLLRK